VRVMLIRVMAILPSVPVMFLTLFLRMFSNDDPQGLTLQRLGATKAWRYSGGSPAIARCPGQFHDM
jgi:hypothetical protein